MRPDVGFGVGGGGFFRKNDQSAFRHQICADSALRHQPRYETYLIPGGDLPRKRRICIGSEFLLVGSPTDGAINCGGPVFTYMVSIVITPTQWSADDEENNRKLRKE